MCIFPPLQFSLSEWMHMRLLFQSTEHRHSASHSNTPACWEIIVAYSNQRENILGTEAMRHVGTAERCSEQGQAGLGTSEPWVLVPALLGLDILSGVTEGTQLLPSLLRVQGFLDFGSPGVYLLQVQGKHTSVRVTCFPFINMHDLYKIMGFSMTFPHGGTMFSSHRQPSCLSTSQII